jgi:hypothetical protein
MMVGKLVWKVEVVLPVRGPIEQAQSWALSLPVLQYTLRSQELPLWSDRPRFESQSYP